jgi:class 3 adenylate cyclase
VISLKDLFEFAQQRFNTAEVAATELFESFAEQYQRKQLSLVANIPRFRALPVGYGVQVWAAILFVDLRSSSRLADLHGPKITYLTMHTFLPTVARLVVECGGRLVGFRGDGLFGAFGVDDDGKNPDGMNEGKEVRKAVRCGKAMLEATEEVVARILKDNGLPQDLRIGVGIAAGKVVVTSIGLREAFEVTAYGSAVNHAAHLSGRNGDVMITANARRIYPKGKGGTMGFRSISGVTAGLKVVYPKDYRAILQK